MKKLLLSVALGCALASPLALAKELPPVGGTPKDFKLTQTQTVTLPNGLEVVYIPFGSTPKATLQLTTMVGNYDDNGKDSLVDIAYRLMSKGNANLSAAELAQQAAAMGGEFNTSVGMTESSVSIDVLSDHIADAVALLATVALKSEPTEDGVEQEKANLMRNVNVQKASAQGQASEAFAKQMFGDHPYSVAYPDEAKNASITVKDVADFYADNVTGMRSTLYVSGKFDQSSVQKAVEAAFAEMPKGTARDIAAPKTQGQGTLTFVPREGAPQSTVRLGVNVPGPSDPDAIGLAVMNTILGGAFSSRITSNIREDKGYTYSPFGTVVNREKVSYWLEGADVTAESTGASLHEIIGEITRLQNEVPSKEEVDGFKSYMSGIHLLRNSSRGAIINQLAFLKRHGLPTEYLENYVSNVNSLTPEKISELAKTHLVLDDMVLVVVGDEASVKPQLAETEVLKGFKSE